MDCLGPSEQIHTGTCAHLHKCIQTWSHVRKPVGSLLTPNGESRSRYTQQHCVGCRGGGGINQKCVDWDIHPSAHMTATSKHAICFPRDGEMGGTRQRRKTQYNSCINNSACLCSACDNAQSLIQLSPAFKTHTIGAGAVHTQPSASQRWGETETKVRQQMQRLQWCLNLVWLCWAFQFLHW